MLIWSQVLVRWHQRCRTLEKSHSEDRVKVKRVRFRCHKIHGYASRNLHVRICTFYYSWLESPLMSSGHCLTQSFQHGLRHCYVWRCEQHIYYTFSGVTGITIGYHLLDVFYAMSSNGATMSVTKSLDLWNFFHSC